jgi:hypothetical protein
MKMFARLMALIILLGMVGSDAAAQVVPGQPTPAQIARYRRLARTNPQAAYAMRRHRRHRHPRTITPPVAAGAAVPF